MVKVIDTGLEMYLEVVSSSDVMGRNVCFVKIIPHYEISNQDTSYTFNRE